MNNGHSPVAADENAAATAPRPASRRIVPAATSTVRAAPHHQQALPRMATELKASEAVPVGPPSAPINNAHATRADASTISSAGWPPTPPWRARAPAVNMSVAGVSGIN